MLETVAIIGPARFGVPLTQALSAPMVGRLHARGVGFWPQLLACAVVRLVHNAATTAFFIWVIAGGLDAYAGTYDAIGRRFGIEVGTADALALTFASLLAWAAFASTVQVLVYRRGLRVAARRRAPAHDRTWRSPLPTQVVGNRCVFRYGSPRPEFDPRAVALAAAVAFVLLLSSTEWVLIAAVSGWLVAAWLLSRPTRPRSARACCSPRSSPPAPSSSRSAAGSGSTRRSGVPFAPRCWCSPPPGSGPPPAPASSARSRGGRSAGFERSRPRSRRRRCSRRSPPRDGSRGRRGRSSRG